MALNPPGLQLYGRVGELTVVFPQAAVPEDLVAQIQVAHDAERTNLTVAHAVGPHHKGQTPGGHGGRNQTGRDAR